MELFSKYFTQEFRKPEPDSYHYKECLEEENWE